MARPRRARTVPGMTSSPKHVVVVGGGVGGLEATLALRSLAGYRVLLTLVDPGPAFHVRALSVEDPFAGPAVRRYDLARLCAEADVEFVQDALTGVRADERVITTASGASLPYDELVLAVGARRRAPYSSGVMFRGLEDAEAVHGLVQDVELGMIDSVVFAVPTGTTWPLPLYELALLIAERAWSMSVHVDLTFVTPEERPLGYFGIEASETVGRLAARAGITLLTETHVRELDHGAAIGLDGAPIVQASRAVTVPLLDGPRIPGVPADPGGFIPVGAGRRGHRRSRRLGGGRRDDLPPQAGRARGPAGRGRRRGDRRVGRRAGAAADRAPGHAGEALHRRPARAPRRGDHRGRREGRHHLPGPDVDPAGLEGDGVSGAVPTQVVRRRRGHRRPRDDAGAQALAGSRVSVTVLAPEETFVLRAATVGTPFGHGEVPRHDIAPLVAAHGAHLVRGSLAAVDRDERCAIASDGVRLLYDALVVAVGASAEPAFAAAATFTGTTDTRVISDLVADMEAGRVESVAFVVPPGVTWSLPIYELALMTAARLELQGVEAPSTSSRPSRGRSGCSARRSARTSSTRSPRRASRSSRAPRSATSTTPAGSSDAPAPSRRSSASSRCRDCADRRSRGSRATTTASSRSTCTVTSPGATGVYAIGDAAAGLLKHGGLGAQQAEGVAHEIAQRAGAAGHGDHAAPRRPRAAPGGRREHLPARSAERPRAEVGRVVVSAEALWWPPLKVAAPRLARELGRERIMSPVAPWRVVVAGGGVAGVEALLGLRDLGEGALELALVTPGLHFVLRPYAVAEPFGGPPSPSLPYADVAREQGARFVRDRVRAVRADDHVLDLEHGAGAALRRARPRRRRATAPLPSRRR